jgi:tRNA dimethylallyltransferase
MNPKVIFIGGATASGKTSLSLELATKYNGEIISADSRQIYIGMDIGTAKIAPRPNPPADTMGLYKVPFLHQNINHYLVDILYPNQRFTLFDFKKQAYEIIQDIQNRNKTPIIAGGTGLYIDALINNYELDETDTQEDPALRSQIEAQYADLLKSLPEAEAKQSMHSQLAKLDAHSAEKIHFSNIYAVQRALEFATLNQGRSKTNSARKSAPPFEYELVLTDLPRPELYKRIEDRIDEQIEQGLIQETKELLAKYGSGYPALTSLGYKEIGMYLEGELSLPEALEQFKKKTRNYAKRQLTWFRRYQV